MPNDVASFSQQVWLDLLADFGKIVVHALEHHLKNAAGLFRGDLGTVAGIEPHAQVGIERKHSQDGHEERVLLPLLLRQHPDHKARGNVALVVSEDAHVAGAGHHLVEEEKAQVILAAFELQPVGEPLVQAGHGGCSRDIRGALVRHVFKLGEERIVDFEVEARLVDDGKISKI